MMISCSRRTDIPAFYSDWFANRIREGFVLAQNPMNPGQVRRVSLLPADVDCLVFWTKDPAPMLDKLNRLKDYTFYFQFTLTPYGGDMEPHLPPKTRILGTFLRLSEQIGPQKVIWRYDPILLSDCITLDYHVDQFGKLASCLAGYTEKCIISFIDRYRHIDRRMNALSVRAPIEPEMRTLAQSMAQMAKSCGMMIETCAEKIDLSASGIGHGKCIDDRLVSALTGKTKTFSKDRYQRKACGCVASIDIGRYNTCPHLCRYCYANVSPNNIEKNRLLHDDQSPLLIGRIDDK